MAKTLGNALKRLIESSGLGVSAFRDGAPNEEQMPFVTILEAVSVTPDGYPDGGSGGSGIEMIQIDVWEVWKDDLGFTNESQLPARIVELLQGCKLDTAPVRVHGVAVVSQRRLLEVTTNTVHTAITVNVHRDF